MSTNDKINRDSIEYIISQINKNSAWWHTITLGQGIKTPGHITQAVHDWTAQAIPDDLSGQTVLDIGAWDGYYSFLCERRGATVTATDWIEQSGFNICRELLKSQVKFMKLNVYDADNLKSSFDYILFFGVYYHLQNPLLALEKLYKITRKSLIVEGHFVDYGDKPLMVFYPDGELAGDYSNWWGPNEHCLLDMLKVVGFHKVTTVAKHISNQLIYGKPHGRIIIEADV